MPRIVPWGPPPCMAFIADLAPLYVTTSSLSDKKPITMCSSHPLDIGGEEAGVTQDEDEASEDEDSEDESEEVDIEMEADIKESLFTRYQFIICLYSYE